MLVLEPSADSYVKCIKKELCKIIIAREQKEIAGINNGQLDGCNNVVKFT
jgi:hypothetical protein